ncbi:C40 family peptidase [Lysinibacillus odysseyi]|uniref:C40 family peptidase n=1 Tax=Lysinibacillus odysseyi TaxID=202611 RepID=UPI00055F9590|nr:C40 family peptidase [Lysinibacillus odysseyi]
MSKIRVLKYGALALIAAIAIFFSPVMGDDKAEASTLTVEQLQATAKQFIGVKYSYGGTTTSGFDCSGYVRHVYNQVGVSLPRTSKSMYGTGTAIKKGDLKAGDLVFFNTSGKGISHVGIYIGGSKFIHSMTGKGVTITDINDKWYWGSRYVGAKRVATVQ